MTRRDHTVSIAEDDRARIPFALIGVVVLISSVAVVGTLQTRPEPQPDTDPSLAMDRAVSTSQTAIKDAVRTAMKDAAAEPLTTTADTPVGNAIDDSGGDTFQAYVKLRVYLETADALRTSGQRVDAGTRTDLSLPPVEYTESSIEDAIDRVDLTVGHESGSLSAGKVTAEISGIDVAVRENGSAVATDTRTISVTVSSTTFALDEKVTEYENRLNRGFFEGDLNPTNLDGFGQQFAARLYPMAYAKAYYERMFGNPVPRTPSGNGGADVFKRISKNKHAEVLANDAVFGIQKKTFDATDPYAARTMKGEWACMGFNIGEKLLTGSQTSTNSLPGPLSGSTFCRGAKALFGDANGNLPEIPTPGEFVDRRINSLFGPSTSVNTEHQMSIDRFAEAAYEDMIGGRMDNWDVRSNRVNEVKGADKLPDLQSDLPNDMSPALVQRAIDDTYKVQSWASDSVAGSSISIPSVSGPDDDDLSSCTEDSSSYQITSASASASRNDVWNSDADGDRKTLVRYDVTADVNIEESAEFSCDSHDEKNDSNAPFSGSGSASSSGSVSFSVEIDGKHSTDTGVFRNGVDNDYGSNSNFKRAISKAVSAHLADDGAGSIESDVSGLGGTGLGSSTSSSEIEDEVVGSLSYDGSQKTHDLAAPSGLSGTIRSDLRDFKGVVKSEISDTSFSRIGMATGKGPFEKLKNKIQSNRVAMTHHDRSPSADYDSAEEKATVQGRRIFLNKVVHWIDEINSTRNQAKNKANNKFTSKIGGAMDGLSGGINVLNKGLKFAQEQLSGDVSMSMANRGTVEDTPLTEDITYSVHGSPTYLTTRPVTRATVPQVRPGYANVSSPQNTLHSSMSVRNHDLVAHPGLPIIPWPTFWYLSVDAWSVHVKGEYARFAVSANKGDPSTTGATTYVRQQQPVTVDIAGRERRAGTVEPISFDSDTLVAIPVPGGTVLPGRGSMAVGDRIHGHGTGVVKKKCSKTWGHVGPGFDQSKASTGPNCARPGPSGSFGSQWLPGSNSGVSWDDGGLEFQAAGVEIDDDGFEYEGVSADPSCDEDTLYDALNDQPENRYSSADDIDDPVWKKYCRLLRPEYRTQFAEFLGSGDDDVHRSWERAVKQTDIRVGEVRETINYVVDDPGEPLDEQHDITEFELAENTNEDEGGVPSHETPGIVIYLTTDESDTFGRVYDSNNPYEPIPSGSWLARTHSITGKDEHNIINTFALWDNRIVDEDTYPDGAWGDYDCIAKVFIPEDRAVELSVSTTGGFSANARDPLVPAQVKRVNPDGEPHLDGGIKQFQILADPGGQDWELGDDDLWAPLGPIEQFADDPETLRNRMGAATQGENLAGGAC